jgi:hypothetical protein
MGLDENLPHDSIMIPRARVAVMTSDTTNVMPATARELLSYPMCEGMIWVPCISHVLNLFLVDQLTISSFKLLLQHSKQIVSVFRAGAFHKLFIQFTRDAHSRLQLPVKTRWCSFSDMLRSLLRYKAALRSAVLSEEYVAAAQKAAKRSDDSRREDADLDDLLGHLDDCDVGMSMGRSSSDGLVGTGKYCAVYDDINDAVFWDILQQYVKFNELVCRYIFELGSPSATLCDAARAMLLINAHMEALSTDAYPALFGGRQSRYAVPPLQDKWRERFKAAMTDHHYLALLLDPRPAGKMFVKEQKLLGCAEDNNRGNTPAVTAAIRSLHALAAVCVKDDQLPANARSLAAKQYLLEQQLLVYLGVHPVHIPWSTLKINLTALERFKDSAAPLSFWQMDVPPDLPLRCAGQRVTIGKAAGTAVERVWSHFGKVFVPSRRSLKSSRVAKLVYVKLNMHLLGDSSQLAALGVEQLNDPVQYTSVLEEAQSLDDEEFVRSLNDTDSVAPASVVEVVEDGVDEEQPTATVHDWLSGFGT